MSKINKESLKHTLNEIAAEVSDGARGLTDSYLRPALKLAESRAVSGLAGAKTGFLFGLKKGLIFGGHHSVIAATFIGAATGVLLGPEAVKKVEDWLGPAREANENAPSDKSPGDKPPPP